MDDSSLDRYVDEVQLQAKFAVTAMQVMQAGLQDREMKSTSQILFGAQGVLTAAAQVSKLLWADTSASWPAERVAFAVDRAASLRKAVGSPRILQKRSVRNAIEHFDERLDSLFFEHPKIVTVDSSVFYSDWITIHGAQRLRTLEWSTMTYSALDQNVNLIDLHEAMSRTAAKARAWQQKRFPARRPHPLLDPTEAIPGPIRVSSRPADASGPRQALVIPIPQ